MSGSHTDDAMSAHDRRDIPADDLGRDVYGILGVPIDVVDMASTLRCITKAARKAAPFLVSTVNLNFLVASQTDADFRDSLLRSDLCTADGMPIGLIGRLLGVPIVERVAGSDIFEALKRSQDPLKVFLFGGADGVAAAACEKVNAGASAMRCVGAHGPGFGSLDKMSADSVIDAVNASKADFLAVALGAKKGQAWLLQNHERIRIPVRSHLGATLNFQAGMVRRAPPAAQKAGLEWLWRIKEEPQLWRRYASDGLALLKLLITRVLPLMTALSCNRLRYGRDGSLAIERTEDHKSVILSINGDAIERNVSDAVASFRDAAAVHKHFVINFTKTRLIDARFLGLLLMLRKQVTGRGGRLNFVGMTPQVAKIFRLNGFGYLLTTNSAGVV